MNIKTSFALITVFACSFHAVPSNADSELTPTTYVVQSYDGRYYFKMVPDDKEPWNIDQKGEGRLYRVNSGDNDTILWKTTGWYANQVHISADGKYLVRIGNWPRGHMLKESDLAVAFYKEGKFIKSYSTKDLVRDESAVRPSVSHYFFLTKVEGISSYSLRFSLTTIDNIEYTFDISTGDVVSEKRVQ